MRAFAICLATLASVTSALAREITAQDQAFVKQAWIANKAELMLGKLAEKRGRSKFVRQFGTMMAKHHKTANEQLVQLAKAENIDLPMKLDKKHQDLYAKLSGLRGAAFDREYKAAMFKGHREVYDKFTQARREASNSNVKNYAERYTPIIAMHLECLQNGKIM